MRVKVSSQNMQKCKLYLIWMLTIKSIAFENPVAHFNASSYPGTSAADTRDHGEVVSRSAFPCAFAFPKLLRTPSSYCLLKIERRAWTSRIYFILTSFTVKPKSFFLQEILPAESYVALLFNYSGGLLFVSFGERQNLWKQGAPWTLQQAVQEVITLPSLGTPQNSYLNQQAKLRAQKTEHATYNLIRDNHVLLTIKSPKSDQRVPMHPSLPFSSLMYSPTCLPTCIVFVSRTACAVKSLHSFWELAKAV